MGIPRHPRYDARADMTVRRGEIPGPKSAGLDYQEGAISLDAAVLVTPSGGARRGEGSRRGKKFMAWLLLAPHRPEAAVCSARRCQNQEIGTKMGVLILCAFAG